MPPYKNEALTILRSTFGFDEFRGQQEPAINQVLAGGDALVLMPTGGGKSLCYQIPALAMPGTGIVVSPLIALMQNQVEALRELGVKADYLNSTLTARQSHQVKNRLLAGKVDLLYVAPERLVMDETLALLHQIPLSLFAVDEAHCISQWGHDFRKDYLSLSLLAEEFPRVPKLALTATADERTRIEIIQRLKLKDAKTFVSSFNRHNIRYRIAEKRSPKEQLLQFISEEFPNDAGIVYCMSRSDVEKTAAFLVEKGYPALPYHAGLPTSVRAENLDRFLKEDGLIVVATIAFGMGIDKPDVRFVAHLDLPRNLEAYYQETGRAGRDGLPSMAWMVYGIRDVIALRQMLSGGSGSDIFKRTEFQKIQAMLGFCEVTSCRRQVLLAYFGETLPTPCGNCDTCLTPAKTWDATTSARKALSCIFRTGQRFGVNHLIDVLLGRESDRVKSFRHHLVSTFGIGKEHEEFVWRSVYRQLLALGYVKVDDFGSLQLSPESLPLLKGEQTLSLRYDMQVRALGKKRHRRKSIAPPRASEDQDLWAALVKHRQALASSQNLPSYCIFQNATLSEMVRQKPSSLAALRQIPGVGDVKMAKYGAGFLEVIRRHSSFTTDSHAVSRSIHA